MHVCAYYTFMLNNVISCCILTGVYFEKIPERKTVYFGDKVDLSIDLFCQGPVSFTCQWYFEEYNQVPIALDDPGYDGSQTTTLIINECQSKHWGNYKCAVTNDADNLRVSCETLLIVHRGMLSRIVHVLTIIISPTPSTVSHDLSCPMEWELVHCSLHVYRCILGYSCENYPTATDY